MLLGAWPIGGVKHSNHPNPNDKNGKCRFAVLCGCYALFLIVGAAIFSVIEAPQLDKYQRELIAVKDKFAQRNPCLNRKFLFYAIENYFSTRLLCVNLDAERTTVELKLTHHYSRRVNMYLRNCVEWNPIESAWASYCFRPLIGSDFITKFLST